MFKWHALEAREKKALVLGVTVAALFLIYIGIYKPATKAKQALQQEVSAQQQLLPWMRTSVNKIMQLRAKTSTATIVKPEQLLNTIARSLASSSLHKVQYEIKQSDNHVSIVFQEVPFNHLIHWLNQLWIQYQINTDQLQASPHQPAGLVQASVKLSL